MKSQEVLKFPTVKVYHIEFKFNGREPIFYAAFTRSGFASWIRFYAAFEDFETFREFETVAYKTWAHCENNEHETLGSYSSWIMTAEENDEN